MPSAALRPTVAITADRRRDEQAVLLERAGFEVQMFPLLRTQADNSLSLQTLTEHITAQPPDFLLANTGFGMRSWFGCTAEWGIRDQLIAALSATTIAARGAKALGELRKVGLDAAYKAPGETLEETVDWLVAQRLADRSVVVQLHGEPSEEAIEKLRSAGADVVCVPVYRMASGQGPIARALVLSIADRSVDAVTFTAAPQVHALFLAGESEGGREALLSAFNEGGTVAACIGDVCAGGAKAHGIARPLVPEHPRLASLANALASYFSERELLRSPRQT
ncbi:MAG TPA: uroporphyrinogen-III synthase [Acidimicrobiales bacterium]|nr:uroporphyrinogen-III synthase [Acidimicrobiales bacterium]